ncbi:histidinol-phosphate transaminase [Streptomyces telluris]|uniref:Aromatic amino acid aminotransferase n=1 Tax=Streptomyces telluris TaxID=2720021 RepID=A0A9X2RMF8_9ACTN|nr:histidinol-phosphate transaminase [Streptomyces telluris]MCQ8771823.1 histidinol-phosphate transaminase [Streptomyces telluris]NJP80415.1 histidinol-phosphate transaminase [Streptomyces telluris]
MGELGPKLRAALEGVPASKPRSSAGVPAEAAAEAPGEQRLRQSQSQPVYKLSANENPYPPLPGVIERAVAGAQGINRYPDLWCGELTRELAARFDVPEAHIATGTGSVGVTQQLLQITAQPGDEVLYAWRSFEAYPVLTRIVGARPVEVPLAAGEVHDLDAMAAAVTGRTRLIFVCNPNNPTGTIVRRAELERFLDRVPSDVLVVLDEAYIEFVADEDFPDGIEVYRDRPNVCVLRTFSKAYGLAGMRVGFAFAHEPVAAALRKTAVPFGVTQFAQDAAVASLRAEAGMRERVEALTAERRRVSAALAEQGWALEPSHANFVWLRTGERTDDFAALCEREGILVRAFSGEGARVSLGEPAANDRFLYVAERFRKELPGR